MKVIAISPSALDAIDVCKRRLEGYDALRGENEALRRSQAANEAELRRADKVISALRERLRAAEEGHAVCLSIHQDCESCEEAEAKILALRKRVEEERQMANDWMARVAMLAQERDELQAYVSEDLIPTQVRLQADLDALAKAARAVVKGIDDWNEGVQRVIGRTPNYTWGALDALKALLAEREVKRG